MQNNPNDDDNHSGKGESDVQFPECCLLSPFNSGDDWRAAMRTIPRMVTDLSAAFVTFDESHGYGELVFIPVCLASSKNFSISESESPAAFRRFISL